MSDHDLKYPISPDCMDWNELFGPSVEGRSPEFADIGCGYGGLLVKLAPMFPDVTMVGMEIRVKVADFVQERVKALRSQNPGRYDNICCMRSNAMKNLPNFFRKSQLSKMFFLFPDPHFKKTKHKWRIISTNLLAEYAYVLRPGGRIYTITDVEELHHWMVNHLQGFPLFRRLTDKEYADDVVVPLLFESTEEGQKVTRNSGNKWAAVFQRLENPPFEETNQHLINTNKSC
ncbi:hypothetical protein niasHT_015402 [Heterodera trifolii]|uniref:tRNA (guanine-N(7)-)-methyltransferase n=1 Tax=Heterodera trifolii TaxID=157864 RepID=A0ABD2KZT2_9BILA